MEFYEEQKFNQKWLWTLLICTALLVIGLFGYGFIKQVLLGKQFGDKPMSNNGLTTAFILTFLLFSGMIWLFSASRLITRIDKFGIAFRFIPFQLKFKTISWNEIERFEVRKYKPLSEFGGWGIKYGKRERHTTLMVMMDYSFILKPENIF